MTFEGDALFTKIYEDWLEDYRDRGIRLSDVKLRAAYTRAVYHAQPAEFQHGLREERDEAYEKDMEAYRQQLEAADEEKTPEYYDRVLSKTAYYLYPFAEHLQQIFGMCVSILLTGPIGANKGAIGMKSVHVGTTSNARSLKWMDDDSFGFEAMEASYCRFGSHCFTKEECAACIVPTITAASEADVTFAPTSSHIAGLPSRRPPYVRQPFVWDGNEMSRDLDELAWGMLEDKRQSEWDGVDDSPGLQATSVTRTRAGCEPSDSMSDNPFAGMHSTPKTPARTRPSGVLAAAHVPTWPSFHATLSRCILFACAVGATEGTGEAPIHVATSIRLMASDKTASQCPRNDASGLHDDLRTWPDKMQELFRLFTHDKDWGAGWTACVNEWVAVQRIDEFQVAAKSTNKVGEFSSKVRPSLIGTWISHKRLPKDREITDVVDYSAKWWRWWGVCQPEECSMDNKGRPGPPAEGLDWSCMDVTTSCGLVLIMVSLSFWGAQIFDSGGATSCQMRDWSDAVSQVTTALAAIRQWKNSGMGESGKRTITAQPSSSSRPVKRRKA
ncbi:hypothetical protein EWM64_g5788 [Hericium alpestre]|uniref:Uncharacterized protein n=1 Tax=Hericium alpestre TaxID=135208 RepID=A0A4Y9ZXJ4_9AGAM|nr:hypothetical protein EWM64_g5788 [Hericium alpestre]